MCYTWDSIHENTLNMIVDIDKSSMKLEAYQQQQNVSDKLLCI